MLKCTMRKRHYFKEVIKTSSFFPTTWLTQVTRCWWWWRNDFKEQKPVRSGVEADILLHQLIWPIDILVIDRYWILASLEGMISIILCSSTIWTTVLSENVFPSLYCFKRFSYILLSASSRSALNLNFGVIFG